ncbi:MAG: hypothetical protein EHM45_23765 [Desulfobacteraceae bacterium]|nr:MAG: hypothetical protein EHM45_23765 [Desulfobacteraceae bacterium]
MLFFSSRDDQNTKRLAAVVCKVIPENQIESFYKLEDFRDRLRKPIEPDSIAVLTASNQDELQQMQTLRDLLTEIYVVLIIPDQKKSTIGLAHLLLPRFLSQKENSFMDLEKVIEKMYKKSHPFEKENGISGIGRQAGL